VDLDSAQRIFDKLVKEKKAKGYGGANGDIRKLPAIQKNSRVDILDDS
jgi:predicted DNA-binding WGR domain protein